MRHVFFILILALASHQAFSQGFIRELPGIWSTDTVASSLFEQPDGGFLLFNRGTFHKFDQDGNIEVTRRFGTSPEYSDCAQVINRFAMVNSRLSKLHLINSIDASVETVEIDSLTTPWGEVVDFIYHAEDSAFIAVIQYWSDTSATLVKFDMKGRVIQEAPQGSYWRSFHSMQKQKLLVLSDSRLLFVDGHDRGKTGGVSILNKDLALHWQSDDDLAVHDAIVLPDSNILIVAHHTTEFCDDPDCRNSVHIEIRDHAGNLVRDAQIYVDEDFWRNNSACRSVMSILSFDGNKLKIDMSQQGCFFLYGTYTFNLDQGIATATQPFQLPSSSYVSEPITTKTHSTLFKGHAWFEDPFTRSSYIFRYDSACNLEFDQGFVFGTIAASTDCSEPDGPATFRYKHVEIRDSSFNLARRLFTNSNGQFRTILPPGDYSLIHTNQSLVYERCMDTIPFSVSTQDTTHLNAFMTPTGDCAHIEPVLILNRLRRCQSSWTRILYENTGNLPANNVRLEITIDPFLAFETATLPYSQINDTTIRVPISGLSPKAKGKFDLKLSVRCDAPLGYEHCINVKVLNNPCPIAGPENFTVCRENVDSYDPNEKVTYPNYLQTELNHDPAKPIEYLINFQNTGTDTAYHIYIMDTLSSLLDISTLEILQASHTMQLDVIDQHILRFAFLDIKLIDSLHDERLSHGSVLYKINPRKEVLWDRSIVLKNKADIIFDFNAPVATNVVTHAFDCSLFTTIYNDSLCFDQDLEILGQVYSINNPHDTLFVAGQDSTECDTLIYVDLTFSEELTLQTVSAVIDTSASVGVEVVIHGGILPLTYTWSSGDSTAAVFDLPTGEYSLTVTDAIGCEKVFTINVGTNTSAGDLTDVDVFDIYPNPTDGTLLLRGHSASFQDPIQIKVYDHLGRLVHVQLLNDHISKVDLTEKAGGLYYFTISSSSQQLIQQGKIVLIR